MFKNLNIKKILSSILGLLLVFPCIPVNTAQAQISNATKTAIKEKADKLLNRTKQIVSSPKFIVPTAIVGAISATAITSHIYNTKFTKPRNPVDNKIVGKSDADIITYHADECLDYNKYATVEYCKHYYGPYYTEDKVNFHKKIGPKINEILTEMKRNGRTTDFEKAVFLHDYICDHCKYPIGTMVDIITGDRTNFDPPHSSEAYGCLINGKAKCSGIATSYSLLLNSAGVECRCICGDACGGGHAWNIVKINGQWYHVDVTLDLFLKAAHSRYKWFMLSEEEISKDHNIY